MAETAAPPQDTTATNGGSTSEPTSGASVDPQDGLFDTVLEDADLEAALEERERKRQDKSIATGRYKEAHDAAKAKIGSLELEDESVVRCGRFRIKTAKTAGRSVSFETSPSSRLTISLLKD